MATRYLQLFDLQTLVGHPLGSSEWLTVAQARIDSFAAATAEFGGMPRSAPTNRWTAALT